jgi:hypothetical protein
VLAELAAAAQLPVRELFAPPLLAPLLSFLELEARCQRWYNLSKWYFEGLAAEVRGVVARTADCAAPCAASNGAAAEQAGPPGARTRTRKRQRQDSAPALPEADAAGAGCSAPQLPPWQDEVVSFLTEKVSAIESAVYGMPSEAGAAPSIFKAAVPPHDQGVLVVDIVGADGAL